ncbi:hypothetical protein CP979_07395 [Streptomyces filamentosus]|nr:hypothetical protein CP979_07395 [Streptomyces filamentosus]
MTRSLSTGFGGAFSGRARGRRGPGVPGDPAGAPRDGGLLGTAKPPDGVRGLRGDPGRGRAAGPGGVR